MIFPRNNIVEVCLFIWLHNRIHPHFKLQTSLPLHDQLAVGLLSDVFQAHTWYDVKCRMIVLKCQEREPLKSLLPSTKSYMYVCIYIS